MTMQLTFRRGHYTGHWVLGKRQGHGTFRWASWATYVGTLQPAFATR